VTKLTSKQVHGRPKRGRIDIECQYPYCQSLAFERHEPIVDGFANDCTMTYYPGMSDDTLTIPSHPDAQFARDAMSS